MSEVMKDVEDREKMTRFNGHFYVSCSKVNCVRRTRDQRERDLLGTHHQDLAREEVLRAHTRTTEEENERNQRRNDRTDM